MFLDLLKIANISMSVVKADCDEVCWLKFRSEVGELTLAAMAES